MGKRTKKQQLSDASIYCVKCKQHTPTSNAHVVRTKNKLYRLTGKCEVCGTMKSKFLSKNQGEGILGNLLGAPGGKLPILGDIPILGALF